MEPSEYRPKLSALEKRLAADPKGLAIAQTANDRPGASSPLCLGDWLLICCAEFVTGKDLTPINSEGRIVIPGMAVAMHRVKEACGAVGITWSQAGDGLDNQIAALEVLTAKITGKAPEAVKPAEHNRSKLPAASSWAASRCGVKVDPKPFATPAPTTTPAPAPLTPAEEYAKLQKAAADAKDPKVRSVLAQAAIEFRNANWNAIFGIPGQPKKK